MREGRVGAGICWAFLAGSAVIWHVISRAAVGGTRARDQVVLPGFRSRFTLRYPVNGA